MRAFLLSDGEYRTPAFERLDGIVCAALQSQGFEIEHREITSGSLKHCIGCFGCWIKIPGECILRDGIDRVNRSYVQSDVAVFLSPVVFGQLSGNLKNALDRWLPNMLPLFVRRKDGSSMHPPRYPSYPKQFVLGYGEDVTPEEAELFVDIIRKHRSNVEALVYTGDGEAVERLFRARELRREGGSL